MRMERLKVRPEQTIATTETMIEEIKAFLADLLIFACSLSSLTRVPSPKKPKNPKNP